MQSRDFVFWMQGFFELSPPGPLSVQQVEMIKAHLALVFQHDPSIPKQEMTHPVSPQNPVGVEYWKQMQDAYQTRGIGAPNSGAASIC